jgi:glycerol-3-phosphate dehydrogenase (NAD(P)+)
MQKQAKDLNVGVVGAGSWGTALANLLALKDYKVDLWVFEEEIKKQIQEQRENRFFLPGVSLSPNIMPSNDITGVVTGKDMIVIVVPSHHVRNIAGMISPHISKDAILVSASKGIENKSHLTMTGVLHDALPAIRVGNLAVLSGPSFAKEVARQVPTVITAASRDPDVAEIVQHAFATPYFRVYRNDDTVGVELGGSVKNVIGRNR